MEDLARVVASPRGGPFARETIVVQGRGMAAFLTQQLAARLGVWANPDFSFPRRYVERCLQAVMGEEVSGGTVSEDKLTWLVLAAFETCLDAPVFAPLHRYLRQDPQHRKRFQLARRLGTLFDRYLTYRPEMIRAFSAGADAGLASDQLWQAALWRIVEPKLEGRHGAALEPLWHERLESFSVRPAALPNRVCLFGISSLPPQYVRVVAAASRLIETHVFVFSPSDKDWWNSADRRSWAHALSEGEDPVARYFDKGHPLVASCGAVGADFRRVLTETFEALQIGEAVHECFASPPLTSNLGRLQADIFALQPSAPVSAPPSAPRSRKRPQRAEAQMALPFAPAAPSEPAAPSDFVADESLTVLACHGPMREVEVCRDHLLALLTRTHDPVRPHEVVVMMADVETYAPFVEAVFGEDPASPTYIPYRIADRTLRTESPLVDAFFRALDLVGSRLTAPAVLDVLSARALEARLDLSDLDRVASWVVDAGIRWGLDEAHRQAHGQPATAQNTWRFGIDRLLLGYAMPADGQATFADVLPYDEVEGKAAAELGTFVAFVEELFAQLRALEEPRPVATWREDLLRFLEHLVGRGEETDREHQILREGLAALASEAAEAAFSAPLALGVMRAWLEERVEAALPERGFLAGGVTFCAMVPMRSIPFRVVCLLGMNDGVFPRATRPPPFDLVARGPEGPKPGDRDRRLDDRYLFLETLCAARERLIITYTGQSIRDNAVRPPSVLVSELLDALAGPDPRRRDVIEHALVVRHPLQGFSRRYFDGADTRLFTFAEAFAKAAVERDVQPEAAPAFFPRVLPPVPHEGQVALGELVRFLQDPLRFLLQRRVRVDFPEGAADIPHREPTVLSPLDKYDLGSRLLALAGDASGRERTNTLVRATGLLPLGALGTVALEALGEEAEAVAKLARALATGPRAPLHFDRPLTSRLRLVGSLSPLFATGLVAHQFGRIRWRQQMSAWLRHLVLNWLAPKGVALLTTLVGRESGEAAEAVQWTPVEQAEDHLSALVELFFQGQNAPLRFLPEASLAFAEAQLAEGGRKKDPMAVAVKGYEERAKFALHWNRTLPQGAPPFEDLITQGPAFEVLALSVGRPLLAHRKAWKEGAS